MTSSISVDTPGQAATENPLFRWLALTCTVITWPLISFGAIVRLKGAGLACPDWPLCYGKVLPPPGLEIALEVGHRFLATFLGILIIALVVMSYRSQTLHRFRKLSVFCLVLVIFQGILGGLTVIMKLYPPIVVSHLLGGLALFGALIALTYLASKPKPDAKLSWFSGLGKTGKRSLVMLLVVVIIIISGGANSSTYSGFACEAFPGCHEGSFMSFSLGGMTIQHMKFAKIPPQLEGNFLPRFQNEWIHMLHRLIAIVGGLKLMFLAFLFRKQEIPVLKAVTWAVPLLVVLEIVIGISNALFRMPVPVSTAHTAVAATLFGYLCLTTMICIYERK